MENIKLLDHNHIQLLNRDTMIDLGGIAVGYALDKVAKILRGKEFRNFFIDAGGDIYVGGHNCSGQPWKIGIKDPQKESNLIKVIYLQDASVTTSGNYEQYFEIQGAKFSYIMNPLTGYPQEEVMSATVIAPQGIEADSLATALCVLGSEEGIALINSLGEGYAGYIITHSKTQAGVNILKSQHYGKFKSKERRYP